MRIFYKNSAGETIDLKSEPYRILTGELFDYSWEPVTGKSGAITGFGRSLYEKMLQIEIYTDRKNYGQAMAALMDVFERDILNVSPGKLYVNDEYLECYIKASRKTEWESGVLAVNELTITTDKPFWVGEHPYTFHSYEVTSSENKRYAGRYPFRYANGLNNAFITNEHFCGSNFTIIMYGPAASPLVSVGKHKYLVNTVLEEGERVEIDSRTGTILKVMNDGTALNMFHYRDKTQDIFAKIQPGRQEVRWPGTFQFDLILYEERSEPKWD